LMDKLDRPKRCFQNIKIDKKKDQKKTKNHQNQQKNSLTQKVLLNQEPPPNLQQYESMKGNHQRRLHAQTYKPNIITLNGLKTSYVQGGRGWVLGGGGGGGGAWVRVGASAGGGAGCCRLSPVVLTGFCPVLGCLRVGRHPGPSAPPHATAISFWTNDCLMFPSAEPAPPTHSVRGVRGGGRPRHRHLRRLPHAAPPGHPLGGGVVGGGGGFPSPGALTFIKYLSGGLAS